MHPDAISTAIALAKPKPHTGPIIGAGGGRHDTEPLDVPPESFVIPADVVSALGQGNTNHGMAILTRMFGKEDASDGVPIMAANGEFVIGPKAVSHTGGGDMKRGHKNLRDFVAEVRKKHIKTLKSLPGPHK